MSVRARFLFSVVSLCSIVLSGPALQAEKNSTKKEPAQVQILYTGSLFGYFRSPDRQSTELRSCDLDSLKDDKTKRLKIAELPAAEKPFFEPNAEARSFWNAVDASHRILLGLGDNFAPELFSRIMTGRTGQGEHSKDIFDWGYHDNKSWSWQTLDSTYDNGQGLVPADNVACFLSRAGYTAIVPGKLDFYFGAGNLRYLARLLAAPTSGTDYPPVQMLGVNLVIRTTVEHAAKRIPLSERNAPYSDDAHGLKFGLPNNAIILPWTSTLKVDNAGPNQEISICPVLDLKDGVIQPRPSFRGYDPKDSGKIVRDPDKASVPGSKDSGCTQLKSVKEIRAENNPLQPAYKYVSNKEAESTYLFPQVKDGNTYLTPDQDYLLCAKNPSDKHPYCQHLSVDSPFFMYPNRIPAPQQKWPRHFPLQVDRKEDCEPLGKEEQERKERQGTSYCDPRPYAFIQKEDTEVAIFGVVDPDITQTIGELNYTWWHNKKRPNDLTQTKVLDPVESLRQLLQYFNEEHPDFKEKNRSEGSPKGHRFKILLAQMPAYKARLIAEVMRGEFNLIIAWPEEEEATPALKEEIEVPASLESEEQATTERQWVAPTFIAVPSPFYHYQLKDRLNLQVRAADLALQAPCTPNDPLDCSEKWTFSSRLAPLPDDCSLRSPCMVQKGGLTPISLAPQPPTRLFSKQPFITAIDTALAGTRYGVAVPGGAGEKLDMLALELMQIHANADVALLQKRDLFSTFIDHDPTAETLQEDLDRVFWKGDLLLKIPVRGDVLKKVIKTSDGFDQEDKNALSLSEQEGRGLVKLGMFLDSKTEQYMINGEPLDDNKLYTVVTSDYVGLGDTGYADLLQPPVGDRRNIPRELYYISSLVCEQIRASTPDFNRASCSKKIPREKYLDRLAQLPFDTTPGLTPSRHFLLWFRPDWPASLYKQLSNAQRPDARVEQRPVWTLSLNRLAASFSMNQHNNGTEGQLAGRFAGVAVPQVNAPNTNTMNIDTSIRLQRSTQHFELFQQSDATYSRQLTRQNNANNTDLESQLKNQMAFEGGILPRLWPLSKEIPDVKALISLRLETQFAPPLISFALGSTPPAKLIGKTARTKTLLGKFGLRYQNRKSSIEGGYQLGGLFSSPLQFTFTPGPASPCSAIQAQQPLSLANCIKQNSTPPTAFILPTSSFAEQVQNRFQHGVFLNFKLNMPLPFNDNLAYVMENKGQLFFNRGGDVSVNTKFVDDVTQSIVVPLWGNFSLTPKLEWFFFQNKVDNNYFRSLQPSVSLQYSFEWRPGISWKNALGYRAPQTSTTPQ